MAYQNLPPETPRPWSHIVVEIAFWLVLAAGAALIVVHVVNG